ncbi:MAG TPA: SusD/RagB family nutrient-binding outer membrane lipoprotein [Chitinophagaceae bacterium]|nr:SusD/RagB family nutrient-binding outer membrane lipoprotein [Chitinophagaceae bacterium]
MKKILFILALILAGTTACKKSDFADAYADPSKISQTTVEKQFTGFLTSYSYSNSDKGQRGYVVPSYWNYFVVLRTTLLHYTQAVGFENADNQYVPGIAATNDRWNDYYNFLAQYRELQNVNAKLSAEDQADRRIYMIAATIFFYDQTQKVVDLHGDIPWSEAGRLSANGGDYASSLPKYDAAASIYTKMLDDLKAFSDELNTLAVKPGIAAGFKNQDLINRGDIMLWKRYCNSLRLRMLTRVSDVPSFQGRANSEIGQILGNPATYPVVTSNAENIMIRVHDVTSDITARGFQSGLEDWNGNIAGKVMIDHMVSNNDPRLRAMYEPGANAGGVYNGLDPMLNRTAQNALIAGGTLAIYNRSTISRNQFFPGILITAAEISFIAAEYYLKAANAGAAKAAYENGIRQSIEYYYWLRTLSNNNVSGTLTPTNTAEINAYIASPGVNWDLAMTTADKLKRIALQKWIHFSVIQPNESWAELRRLDAPVLSFEVDAANAQKQPPLRWLYASNERTYNAANYQAVAAQDLLTTRIFWDVR